MKNAGLIVVALILFVSSSAYGAALGQPQRTSMLGYSLGATVISVDDSAGDTDAVRLWSSVRYWSEFYYYQATLDAGLNRIGQDARRYGMRFSLQKSLPVTPKWLTWLGAGVDISQAKYTTRHTVDDEGFLLETYPDRKETTAAGVINIVGEWSLTRVWTIGAKPEHSFPSNGHIKEPLAAVTLLYRY